MRVLLFIIKELLVAFKFRFNQLLNLDSDLYKEVEELNEQGIFLKKEYFNKEKCNVLMASIDDMLASGETNVWIDEYESDHRVYYANDINKEMKDFFEDMYIRRILKTYLGISNPVGMVLAARIKYNQNNVGSGGGWHRDSPFNHQFKAIIYLNDVDGSNGPFQYIKTTHKFKNTLFSVVRNNFLPGQYRFSEKDVNAFLSGVNLDVSSMCGESGDLILVDTKGIHRGKPLISGSRYALFCYFWDGEIPEHFEKFRQR